MEEFLQNLDFRYDLIANSIYYKDFDELSYKCKTIVIKRYDDYY